MLSGPKVTIIDKIGMLRTFEIQNDTFELIWQMKLPSSRSYFGYYESGLLNIIYGDGKKDMTQIDVKNPQNCHRTLKNSNHLFRIFRHGNNVRVGNYFIIFGGEIDPGHNSIKTGWNFIGNHSGKERNLNLFIWSLMKQRWLKGKLIRLMIFLHGCKSG